MLRSHFFVKVTRTDFPCLNQAPEFSRIADFCPSFGLKRSEIFLRNFVFRKRLEVAVIENKRAAVHLAGNFPVLCEYGINRPVNKWLMPCFA